MSEHQVTGEWPAPVPERTGDLPTVPGYELLEELGRGGMGVVYKARQVARDRLVALKLLRDGAMASPSQRARFRIEADAAARMQHPNVVQIHEVAEHEGRPYFAMELVEGIRLDQFQSGQPQPSEIASSLTRTLALAVEHAHEQQIVHRDLKPSNVLLVGTDHVQLASLQPKITDFGLAKRLDSESTAFTQDGAVLGTASYMAPEQAAGRIDEIGPATDVYGLGAILYELLTGRPPFRAATWHATVHQVLNDEPTPPSRIQTGIPSDLETICLQCLEKEPHRRYSTARELAEDLRQFLEGGPIGAVPLQATERIARSAARAGYRIVGEIGRGPRSIVYHALHEPIQQPVALKVFRPGSCTRESWDDRLQLGAEMWQALGHPQIVPIQEAGWWDDSAYVTTTFVPNRCLASKLDGRPYRVREALRLVAQITEIVSYCHRQGVVHGNLKPSNVLLAADGIPRLADFRLTGSWFVGPLPDDAESTAGIGYLAPELIENPGVEPLRNADIYGLGLILYELLSGRPPFAGHTLHVTLEQVRTEVPAPPSQFNAEVDPELDQVCLKCLRKNPWRRYARAYDLMTRLRQLQK